MTYSAVVKTTSISSNPDSYILTCIHSYILTYIHSIFIKHYLAVRDATLKHIHTYIHTYKQTHRQKHIYTHRHTYRVAMFSRTAWPGALPPQHICIHTHMHTQTYIQSRNIYTHRLTMCVASPTHNPPISLDRTTMCMPARDSFIIKLRRKA